MHMDKLKSFEDYKEAVKRTRALPGVTSNCFWMPSVIKSLIAEGRLYLLESPAGCLLLQEEPTFYRGCYYLSDQQEPPQPVLDRPAVIEYVFQNALSPKQQAEIRRIEQMGFTLGRESGRMILPADQLAPGGAAERVRMAEPGEEAVIGQLFSETFNPLYSYLPTRQELTEAIAAGRVYAVFSRNILCAALYAQVEKQCATIRLLAVSPSYRREGLGRQLVQFYHDSLASQVRTFAHWVDLHNTGAIHLYQMFGYSFDPRRANEYILLERKL